MVDEPRTSPLRSQIALWIGFALIAAASVFTVLLPELHDDSDEAEERDESATTR